MTISYNSGRRIQGTSTDVAPISGGWKEVARTTLGSDTSTIDVSSLTDKRYYMILSSFRMATGGNPYVRLNSDTGNFYNQRYGVNGGDSTFQTGRGRYGWVAGINTLPYFHVDFAANIATKEKLLVGNTVHQNTAGAGNAPNRGEGVWKHSQTSNPITSVNHWDNSGGNYESGSECVVLGWDPDDTHTTNFWEELATNTASGGGSTQEVTFTAKKYLWFQCYFELSGSTDIPRFQVGNGSFDTGNNYAERFSGNGGTDETQINRSDIHIDKASSKPFFVNGFIINNASQEKLFIIHSVEQNTAGAGNAPTRIENVGKWTNTSNQIDRLRTTFGTDTINAGAIMKVWGSN